MNQENEALVQTLIESGAVSQEDVESAKATLQANREAGEQALAGTEYRINPKNYTLHILSYPEGAEQANIELPKPEGFKAFNPEDWTLTGTHHTLFHGETRKKSEDRPAQLDDTLRFIRSEQGLFLMHKEISVGNLALTHHHLLYARCGKQPPPNGPLDAFFSYSGKWLALADRSAGQLYLIDLENQSLKQQMSMRKSGSTRAWMVAIHESREELILIDNTSSLSVFNFAGEHTRKLSPGAGLLGAGVLSADGEFLFALSTKPNPGLKVISSDSGELVKEIAIKGDLYSVDGDAPIDLMALSQDKQALLFMTYLNEPEPFTPIISVVDIERQKTTQRFSIKDGTRPTLLSTLGINPLSAKNQSLIDYLLTMELITAEDLHAARLVVRDKQEQEAAQRAAEAQARQMMDLDKRAFEEAQQQQEEAEMLAEEEQEEGGFKPEKASQMNISPAAEGLIVDQCCKILLNESRGEVDLKKDEQHAGALDRLKSAAARARNELEWHTGAIIRLPKLIGDMNFKHVITRDQMEEMLHIHERDSLVKSQRATVPSNCPNCNKPLFGSYVCTYCGYEIERPEELLKRGLISIATLRPADNLADGHFLLIDIEGKRILEIDTERNIVWSIGKDILSESNLELEFPRDAVRLATRNTLITDYSLNRIVEITPSGRTFWEYDPSESDEHRIKNPVRATANGLNHILIVDQGRHRVIEVNKESEILTQVGTTDQYGLSDTLLNMPSDAQRLANGNLLITDTGNHRIIELEDFEIVWQYGNPENLESGGYGGDPGYLSYPQSALRLDNGNTLVVDAGNLRIIEINPDKEIVFTHKTNEGPEEHQMDSPFKAAYMGDGNIMVLSETAVIEIEPGTDEVTWACQLSQFERAKAVLKVEEKAKRFVKHGVGNPYLRMKNKATSTSDDAQERIQELIAKRMANSRANDGSKAHITRFGEKELSDLDFFLVDRSKNKVIRTNRKGDLSWRYGEKQGELLNKPHSCVRLKNGHIMVVDTDHHRIIEINPEDSSTVWQFGDKAPEKGDKGLHRPRFIYPITDDHFLITDQNNRRVFELKRNKQITWSFEGMDNMMAPYYAERLKSGNTLIVDWGAHYVFEINPEGETVWSFGEQKSSGKDESHLAYPEHATRLDNGNTLISDTRNDRILEISPEGQMLWQLDGKDKIKFSSPTWVTRKANGHTFLLHSSNRQMMEVDEKSNLIWKFMLPFERTLSKKA